MICSKLDVEVVSLVDFTPELLVHCVSKCLRLIQPDLEVPESLPPGKQNRDLFFKCVNRFFFHSFCVLCNNLCFIGIAQRYNVTTTLAEACIVSI